MAKTWFVTLTHVVIFLNGNPYGGPDAVYYASKASAVRSARQERSKGLRVEVRSLLPLEPSDRSLGFGPVVF